MGGAGLWRGIFAILKNPDFALWGGFTDMLPGLPKQKKPKLFGSIIRQAQTGLGKK